MLEYIFQNKKKQQNMVPDKIYQFSMSKRLKKEFNHAHTTIFENKRRFDFSMKSYDNHDVSTETNIDLINLFELILEKSFEILQMLQITKFSRNKYVIDFHQRNCTETIKEKYQWSVWHEDDYQITNYPVWTILYYVRKDKGVKGGNILFSNVNNNNIDTIEIEEGDILIFKGNIFHKPEETWGFGCRDVIVCFIKRN